MRLSRINRSFQTGVIHLVILPRNIRRMLLGLVRRLRTISEYQRVVSNNGVKAPRDNYFCQVMNSEYWRGYSRKNKVINDQNHLWDVPLGSESRLCKAPKEDWICVKRSRGGFEYYPLDEPEQQKTKGRIASLFDL